ncbi:AlpA family transcriptional regulator [Dysgonomonas sp. 520]|uniref:helix-turn-helix transcriptional regulator n=1 Tax=Dysgonomonas sp. 520 TaxID=2302931 RepID=UPI0013D273FC|nr:helix-turn-helix domain-containing protein [Dysgonomonas sp. 520]NDW09408.1 DNA-binding protein [Dysgonomonas sp. 520]
MVINYDLPIAALTVRQFIDLLKIFFPSDSKEESEILDKDGFCELTGYSMDALNKMIQHNEVPYYKGQGRKKIYFKRSEILDWVFSGRVETKVEYLNRKDTEFVNHMERRVS